MESHTSRVTKDEKNRISLSRVLSKEELDKRVAELENEPD